MYLRHGYRIIGVVPAKVFNGIRDIRLVLMEKHLELENRCIKRTDP